MKMNDPLLLVGSLVALAVAFVLGYDFGKRRRETFSRRLRPPPH